MDNFQKRTTGTNLKIEKILVPVDFSDCSQEALTYASTLARTFKAKIIVFHVIDLPVY